MDKIEQSKAIISRLNRINGQIRGIDRMACDKSKSCLDMFTQLSAVKSALDKAALIILEKHTLNCIIDVKNKDEQIERVNHLIETMERYKYGIYSLEMASLSNISDVLKLASDKVTKITSLVEESVSCCPQALELASEVKALLEKAFIMVFEKQTYVTVVKTKSMEKQAELLENLLLMAKKFIV